MTMEQEAGCRKQEADVVVQLVVGTGSDVPTSKAGIEARDHIACSSTDASQPEPSSRLLWLLFVLGWVCPPCWWAAVALGLQCSNRRIKRKSMAESSKLLWQLCLLMSLASAMAFILAFSLRFGTKAPGRLPDASIPPPPHTSQQYYFSLSGPSDSFTTQAAGGSDPVLSTAFAQALHKALNLPSSYPIANIRTWLAAAPTTAATATTNRRRHLLSTNKLSKGSSAVQDTADSEPQGPSSNPRPQQQQAERAEHSDESALTASTTIDRQLLAAQQQQQQQPDRTTKVWGFQLLQLSERHPYDEGLQARLLEEDTAATLLFELVVQGVVNAAAVGELASGFGSSAALAQAAASTSQGAGLQGTDPQEVLQYPPQPLPAGACTCRLGINKERFSMDCPSPWSSLANTSQVPPALTIRQGALVDQQTGQPARLHGINWFGWNTGSLNFDGLWAYADTDIPEKASVGDAAADNVLKLGWWGKRRMTNDFAAVVHRMKLLGFNAVRVQFTFNDLNKNLTSGEEFFPCLLDSDEFIGINKTLDPRLLDWLKSQKGLAGLNLTTPANNTTPTDEHAAGSTSTSNSTATAGAGGNGTDAFVNASSQGNGTSTAQNQTLSNAAIDDLLLEEIKPLLPQYLGMPHPPPPCGNPQCDQRPWLVPFVAGYAGPGNSSSTLNLTMCNYYLPQGPGVAAVHRFLWQVQYLVSQGFYVLLDFASHREREPNLENPQLLAQNWGNLWRMLKDTPGYSELLSGRVFPDLANEPSRWKCQWDGSCRQPGSNASRTCAPILQSFGLAAAAVWQQDKHVPIFINGLGQNRDLLRDWCGGNFDSMSWGDGFITDNEVLQRYNISDPSSLLTTAGAQMAGPGVVLAPHLYPPSITWNPAEEPAASKRRWDLSWGLKLQGMDTTSQGAPMPKTPVIIGEFGVRDNGDNSVTNADTTSISETDRAWMLNTARYLTKLAEKAGQPLSWLFWAWNANSGDTQGIVGPQNTWREVQWTKVRLLARAFGLRPWYCAKYAEFCETVEW